MIMLAEIVSWPSAVVSIVGILAFASFWIGEWPWKGIINIHKHYHNTPRKKKVVVEEDEE